ncbi:MAG: hypothetical protein AAF702_22420 [Chloroflexota bacterium]
MVKIVYSVLLSLGFIIYFTLTASARPAIAPSHQIHCIGHGPLDEIGALPPDIDSPDFCGCTWGEIYYRGRPISQAPVTLQYKENMRETISDFPAGEEIPDYRTSGSPLGATLGDTMTITAQFAGYTVTRTFRAWPSRDANKQQYVPLVIPEKGTWTKWITQGYTNTLAVQENTLWAGGSDGLISVNMTTDEVTTHALPWDDQTVTEIAIANNAHVWVAGPDNLAEFDGTSWQNQDAPFEATIRAMAIEPESSTLWVGGGDTGAALSVFNGDWQTVTSVGNVVTTLTIDDAGDLWAGTWGNGVYRWQHNATDFNSSWTRFSLQDGFASNYVRSAVAGDNVVWFGTRPHIGTPNNGGGVARYRIADDKWDHYSVSNGLPKDEQLPDVSTQIFAFTVDQSGTPWFGTKDSIYMLATEEHWVDHAVTMDANVTALSIVGDIVISARRDGLWRLDRNMTPGNDPTAQLTTSNPTTVTAASIFTLTATAADNDNDASETDQQIIAWDWTVDEKSLCTTEETCVMPAIELGEGTHEIVLRVQDDEGVWSETVTASLTVQPVIFLPFVVK